MTNAAIAKHTGVDDLARANEQGGAVSVLGGLLVRLNLAAMKRAALRAEFDDLRWAVGCARAFADLGAAWLHARPLARETGAEQRLVGQVFAAAGRLFADDIMVALAGPAFLVATPTPAIRRRLDRYARAARTEAPKLIASARAHLIASPSGVVRSDGHATRCSNWPMMGGATVAIRSLSVKPSLSERT